MLAESVSHNVPMRESVRESFQQYAVPHPLKTDWTHIAPLRDKAIKQYFNAIEIVKRERADVEASRREPESAPDDASSQPEPTTAPAGGERDGAVPARRCGARRAGRAS